MLLSDIEQMQEQKCDIQGKKLKQSYLSQDLRDGQGWGGDICMSSWHEGSSSKNIENSGASQETSRDSITKTKLKQNNETQIY